MRIGAKAGPTRQAASRSLRGAVKLAAMSALFCSHAVGEDLANRAVYFDIKPQSLAGALIEFSRQSQIQVMSQGADLAQRHSAGLVGRYTVREALDRLLSETDLEYTPTAPNTIAALPQGGPRGATGQLVASQGTIRLAQADVGRPVSAPAVDNASPDAAGTGSATAAGQPLQEVIVSGSRIVRSGFTAPTPVTVVGAQRIEQLAVTNVGDALNRLPAFRATQSPSTSFLSAANIGARTLDLRGLGAERTLVLVNGRRFIPSSSRGTVDVNLIPAMLIDRVEVVTGGASAAYGSDAVAGVVNILLDDTLTGMRGQVSYGESQRGDNGEYQASFAGGMPFAAGRGHVIVGAEYSDADGMGNCYTRSWCATAWSNFNNPGHLTNGLPALVRMPHTHGATFTPGGLINGPEPLRGIQFLADGSPAPFEYGSFVGPFFMSGGDGEGRNAFWTAPLLAVPVERLAMFGRVNVDLSDDVRAFADLSFGRIQARGQGAQTRDTNIAIQQDNAFLPESIRQMMIDHDIATLSFGRAGEDLGVAINRNDNRTWRLALGLEGELGGGWRWDGYYQYGDNDYEQTVENNRIQSRFPLAVDAVYAPDGSIVCRSALTDPNNGCQPINLFGEFQFSQAAKDWLYGTAWQRTKIEQHVLAFNLQGEPLSTWAGPVPVAFGVEYREDSIAGDADPISQVSGWYVGNGQSVDGKVDVKEAYLETALPLARDTAFAKSLELNGAMRLTEYSTSGTVETWKLGLVYEPLDWVRLRATRSRDIRAPNVQELFGATSAAFGRITDPLTNLNGLPRVFTGGNPDLQPEVADTWTAGVVFTPYGTLFDGLRVSLDYFDISLKDAITTVGAQTIVDRCASGAADFCELITRDETLAVIEVRNPAINLNRLIARGTDLELDYTLPQQPWGKLGVRLLGTWVKDLITIDSVGPTNRAGQTGVQTGATPGLPRWTANASVTYDYGPLTLTLEGRYIPKGKYDATLVGPEDDGYSPLLPNSISTNRVDGRFYMNLAGQYTLVERGGTEIELFGAIYNALDRDPPVSIANGAGTNTMLFDVMGRLYRLGLRFRY